MGLNHVRPSQYMYAHGPGSVLETTSGPVIVEDMDTLFRGYVENRDVKIGGESRSLRITDFEVKERRLSHALQGARLARLPSNEELGENGMRPIYPTLGRIPHWSLCENHEILYQGWSRGRYNPCWKCRQEYEEEHDGQRMPWDLRKRMAARHAMRFVSVCHEGHLDDVPWKDLVCSEGCDSRWLSWGGGGQRISRVWIRCRKCDGSRNLGEMYGQEHSCSGRHWHTHAEVDCNAPARIQQRGAAGLWIPEIVSSLDITGLPHSIFEALNDASLVSALISMRSFGGELTPENLKKAIRGTAVSSVTRDALKRRCEDSSRWPLLKAAIEREVFGGGDPADGDLKQEEFLALLNAAENGSPPPPVNPEDAQESILRVDRGSSYEIDIGDSKMLQIVPIERLRVVNALVGFRRDISSEHEASLVELSFEREGSWFPAMENFGEGVFLHLVDSSGPVSGEDERFAVWSNRAIGDPDCHPVHVWWHTLSHQLIELLGIDSGFSSASIRERTYFMRDDEGEVKGGLLLYTAQPGGDGTLGGLVGIAKDRDTMGRLLQRSLSDSEVCSNDPLCEEGAETNDGAACYACCLISETSCEHRNKMLDRLILRGS